MLPTLDPFIVQVGPESAGAHPGPVAYRKGGHLAITDANLVLGRILPDYFPAIFGESEDQPLDSHAARCTYIIAVWLYVADGFLCTFGI